MNPSPHPSPCTPRHRRSTATPACRVYATRHGYSLAGALQIPRGECVPECNTQLSHTTAKGSRPCGLQTNALGGCGESQAVGVRANATRREAALGWFGAHGSGRGWPDRDGSLLDGPPIVDVSGTLGPSLLAALEWAVSARLAGTDWSLLPGRVAVPDAGLGCEVRMGQVPGVTRPAPLSTSTSSCSIPATSSARSAAGASMRAACTGSLPRLCALVGT